jgi:tetratricopeptide (TPR) repeat protein
LGVLLVTHGAITIGELAAVLELPVHQVRKAIAPIHRFLVGRDQLELMHLELRAVLVEQFTSPAERQAYRRRLLAWCASYSHRGWPTDTPDFVLDRYASHLHEVGDYDELYRLLDRRWMELQAARTHSHQAFARDVLLAIDAAVSEDPPNLVQQVRGSFIYATLTSLATNVPPQLLAVLVRLGQLSRGQGYAALIHDPEQRTVAYSGIAVALFEQEQWHEASRAIDQALTTAQAIPNDRRRAEVLAQVAGALAKAGHPDQARTIADQALTITQTIPDNEDKSQALAGVAGALAKAGQLDQARTITDQALTSAQTIPDDDDKAEALTQVAGALAKAGHPDQARTVAQAIPDNQRKVWALTQVAETLAKTGHPDQALMVITRTLTAVRAHGRSGFFTWLERVAAAPSAIDCGTLIAVGDVLLDAEKWLTR